MVQEPINEAFEALSYPVGERQDGAIAKRRSNPIKLQFGEIVLEREVIKRAPSEVLHENHTGAILCKKEAVHAVCGIRAIWVTPSNRRKGIATQLLEAVRALPKIEPKFIIQAGKSYLNPTMPGYLGILTRNANMLPINYESWHHMPDSNKNQALANIKERFALEVSDDYIKKALGKRWRDNKSTLKKQYFKKDISIEEKLRNVPPGMLRYQWEDAVRFWNSKKGEDRERVGTSSRQKQKFTHTAGSRSFASVAEAEEVKSGQKVGRLQLFEITHRKKDGSPMTFEAREIMEKLKEKKAEYEAIASSDSSVNLENIDNRIITEVLGPERYGRVRFQGSGVTPTQYFGSDSQQYMPSGSQAQAEVQRLRDQIAQMQANTVEQIVEVQRKYEELQQQLRAEAAEREAAAAAREAEARAMVAEQSKKYDDLQLQLQQMMLPYSDSYGVLDNYAGWSGVNAVTSWLSPLYLLCGHVCVVGCSGLTVHSLILHEPDKPK
ncbi:hypothetical protein PVK06_042899 [Gossypium arboreum]|uniref:N-acetyltransferase ESCO acetyl-transferase domain-containing protein n=1 Tax=Gossypium arboreum TaxID=29729 RepID=A0ABR0MM14_GOSAR|nr:hypothetical protein PVK06_042899 [Gossypium arboreum]